MGSCARPHNWPETMRKTIVSKTLLLLLELSISLEGNAEQAVGCGG